MNAAEALYDFFAGFGLPAFEESCVYPTLPENDLFLTYRAASGVFDQRPTGLTCTLWFFDPSLKTAVRIAGQLRSALDNGGAVLRCDGGYIWLRPGAPFMQILAEDGDLRRKRLLVNLETEWLVSARAPEALPAGAAQ